LIGHADDRSHSNCYCKLGTQECHKGPKYAFINDDDVFTLIVKNPEVGDTGKYTCVIRECNDLTCKAYLEVERKNILLLE
jgi:hypothetical protein